MGRIEKVNNDVRWATVCVHLFLRFVSFNDLRRRALVLVCFYHRGFTSPLLLIRGVRWLGLEDIFTN